MSVAGSTHTGPHPERTRLDGLRVDYGTQSRRECQCGDWHHFGNWMHQQPVPKMASVPFAAPFQAPVLTS